MQGAVVCDHLTCQKCDANDDEQEGVQTWTGYKQAGPKNRKMLKIYFWTAGEPFYKHLI